MFQLMDGAVNYLYPVLSNVFYPHSCCEVNHPREAMSKGCRQLPRMESVH